MPASKIHPESTYEAFLSDQQLSTVSRRLGIHKNTLVSWWTEHFGVEAVLDRLLRLDNLKLANSFEAFLTDKSIISVAVELSTTPNIIRTIWVKKFGREAFNERERKTRIEATTKTVKNYGGLSDPWKNKVEGIDYVTCQICGYRGVRIDKHIRLLHGMTVDQYKKQFSTQVQSATLTEKRRQKLTTHNKNNPQKGNTKQIQCSSCDITHIVAWSFAYSTHDARCPACKDREKALKEALYFEGKVENADYVICRICGYKAENLVSHIRSAHPDIEGQYLYLFPGSEVVALKSSIRDKSNSLKGRTLSEETKEKMSENAGRWNKGFTKETHPSVAAMSEHTKGRPAWSKGLTKADHPSLQAAAEKLSALRTGQPSALKANLTAVDFTPFLDETGAVDRKSMAKVLQLSEPTVTKYMEAIGLRLSTKYVDARVERDKQTDRFSEMSRKSAELTTIRLTPDQLAPFRMKDGRVMVGRAMAGLGHVYAVIKRECGRLSIPTNTALIRQTLCLEAVSKALNATYRKEWRSMMFVNPSTGHPFRYDGYFKDLRLIVEFHGYQHWAFPNVFHRTEEDFQECRRRDTIKEEIVRNAGFKYLVFLESDPYTDPVFIRERWLDEIE